MDASTLTLMITVSIFLGSLGLGAFIWGLKTGQFDDQDKMMQGVLFDGEEELNDAAKRDAKQKQNKKEKNSEKDT
ncbi:MAG: cbb3-type cytochrome oxidase assembly protein CcoS [Campylobacterota bacterium]